MTVILHPVYVERGTAGTLIGCTHALTREPPPFAVTASCAVTSSGALHRCTLVSGSGMSRRELTSVASCAATEWRLEPAEQRRGATVRFTVRYFGADHWESP